MRKLLLSIMVFSMMLCGVAFAADGGHTGGVINLEPVTPPPAVIVAVGGESFVVGTIPAVTPEQKKGLEEKYGPSVVIFNLPAMKADKAGIFVFGISLPAEYFGWDVSFLHFFLHRSEVAAKAAAVTVPKGGHKYVDAKGDEVKNVPSDGQLFVAVDVAAAGTYEPIIAAQKKSGDKSGDSGGSGCDAGFSVAALLSLGALFFLKKRS